MADGSPSGGADHQSLSILRLTLMRELETINQYQDFHDKAQDPVVKALMGHLMFEEKEHVAELTEMLKQFDADQRQHFEGAHATSIGHVGGLPAAPLPLAPEPEPQDEANEEAAQEITPEHAPMPTRGALTVGSTMGKLQ